jgi:DNA-binding beta-propeller fold protein YncE
MPRFVLALVLAVALVTACDSSGSESPTVAPSSTVAASPATSPSAEVASSAPSDAGTPLAERVEAEIAVPGSPDWPLAAFGSIWVIAPDLPIRTGEGTPNLVRIDPSTNEISATIELPDRLCQGFTASDDAIWVCAADALIRVDPATNEITDTVPIKGAQAFYRPAFGGGMVWALGSTSMVGDTVIRLDPVTRETTSFPVPGSVGGLAYGFDALWLAMPGEGTVLRLDPSTGATEVIASGLVSPKTIVAGTDSLWVALHGGSEDQAQPGDPQVARIDPTNGEVLAEIEVGGSPQFGVELWADPDGVLVRSTTPWLARIDEETNEVVDPVVSEQAIQGPLTTGFGSIWTINIERDVVYRVKP